MIVEHAPAKLNLALHVRARRADGFHELETLFAFCRDGDLIEIERADSDSFVVDGPFAGALSGEDDNLVLRARRAFAARVGDPGPVAIRLVKRLPVASGLGGGSADAAATLRALARLEGNAADDPRLFAIAEGLGSDVPACLLNRPAIGRGRGERLEAVKGVPHLPVLLVNPGMAVPTGPVFAAWDGVDRGPLTMGSDVLAAVRAGRNDLATPAITLAPAIAAALALMEDTRPLLARMSGSGATCFALYPDQASCTAAAEAIGAARPDWWCLETELG